MDFVESYFGADDLASFKKYFSLDSKLHGHHSKDPIVKAGGLQAMLACFLKHNKDVLKEFKAHLEGGSGSGKSKKAVAEEKGKKNKKKEEESSSSEEEEESESSESEEESDSEEEKKVVKKVGDKRKAKE